MFPQVQKVWSNVFSNDDTESSYSVGKEGFAYEKYSGRSIRAETQSYSRNGFTILFNTQSQQNTNSINQIISYLKENNWIDVQTNAIVVETNFIFKNKGIYVMNNLIIELTIDNYNISNIPRFLTPLYNTTLQIVFTVLTFIASVLLMAFSIFDLK